VKIVFLNRYFFPDHSATSQILSDLAFHLADAGFEVHVIASRQRYDDPGAMLARREIVRGVTAHRVWTATFGRGNLLGRALDYLTFYPSAAFRLAMLASKGDVVVAKTDPPLLSIAAWPVARLKGARLVNWLHDLFPEVAAALRVRGFAGVFADMLMWMRDRSLKAAACNVVLGDRMSMRLQSRGVPAEKIRVIENWADGSAIRPVPASKNPLRREWGLEGRFIVGYSGNMGRVHEFDTLLDAMERLRDLAGLEFLFIGSGNQRDWLEEEARRRAISNLRFRPYQRRERLAESLSVPDVHLVSLRAEMEGLVVPSKFYGIAAAGRPIVFVGARDGEIAQKVARFECGIAVEQGDANGLAEAIARFARDRILRERLGRNARAAFESRWDKRIACAAWRELLEAVVRGSR